MEPTTAKSRVTPKDFFLWLGVIIAVYGTAVSLITLFFEYINNVYPDPLAYSGDPYSGAVRFAMATLIVFTPAALALAYVIRKSIQAEPGKAEIWVRRWAIVLTLFIAALTIAIDLVTLINTFLGGEITMRFFLKVAVVLLVAGGIFMHFMAELKGYWFKYPKKAQLMAAAVGVLVVATIGAGFLIIGTPGQLRLARFDEQKVGDLQNIQYQVLNYYQQKQVLPENLAALADPLSGATIPSDPQSQSPYTYEVTGKLSFKLCATFNQESRDLSGKGGYEGRDIAVSYPSGMGIDENWKHGEGETCFTRTIDPERYPPYPKGL